MKENSLEENPILLNISSKDEENQNQEIKIVKDKYEIERNLKYPNYNHSLKIILLGDSMVGKSSIIHRLCEEKFDENIVPTLSIEYFNYFIKINDYVIRTSPFEVTIKDGILDMLKLLIISKLSFSFFPSFSFFSSSYYF